MPLVSRNDLSRGFWLNLEFTRKFTSRDFVFYIKPMRSEILLRLLLSCEVI